MFEMLQHKDLLTPPSRHTFSCSILKHHHHSNTHTNIPKQTPITTSYQQPPRFTFTTQSTREPVWLHRLVTHLLLGLGLLHHLFTLLAETKRALACSAPGLASFCHLRHLTHSTEITQNVFESSILDVGLVHTSSTSRPKDHLITTAQEAEDEHHANLLPRPHRPRQALQGGCPVRP